MSLILTEVAQKIETLLNAATGFEQYQFVVETQGFHLDHISDKTTGHNFIPVFISTMGGQNNPVPGLKQAEATVPITFYYPVRFKDDFYLLYDYLVDTFVGQFITFGTQKARCNISLPQFGEIVDLDLKEFKEWVGSIYRKVIEVMEPYLSMTVTLYLSTAGGSFIYGDDIKITNLVVYYNGNSILTDTAPISIERADIGSSETAPQQAFGESYIKGYSANLGYTKELPLIIKNTSGYKSLINICEVTKDIQNLKVTITEEFPFSGTPALTSTHTYYVTNYSRRTAYGSLFGISLTLADLRS